jgi:hypothetical protein
MAITKMISTNAEVSVGGGSVLMVFPLFAQ